MPLRDAPLLGAVLGYGVLKLAQYPIKKRIKLHGLDISVENPKGSSRHWKDPHSGESGTTVMKHDYGYFRRTEGTDGDHVDVYVGPDADSSSVFIVDQLKKPDFKEFDEQKVMLGFKDAKSAKAAYLAHYNDPRFFGSMKEMAVEDFKKKALSKENHGKKIAKETGMPFQSKRQMRAAFGGHIPGISKKKAREWAKETPDIKSLPERAPAEKGKPTLLSKESGWYADAQRRTQDPMGSILNEVSDPASLYIGPEHEDEWARREILATPTARHHRWPMQLVGGVGGATLGAGVPALLNQPGWASALGGALGALGGGYAGGKLSDSSITAPIMRARQAVREELAKGAQLAHAEDSGKGLPVSAIRRGQKVEMEHTKNPATARQIAVDHLRERPDYYARLSEAEKQAAMSPAGLRALQHGGIGAGAGALLGAGIGAYRADPENRGRGALKGALTGAGIGFAGGAGGSLLHSRIKAPALAGSAQAVKPPSIATSPTVMAPAQTITQSTGRPAVPPPQNLNFPKRTSAFQITSPSELRHLEAQGWKLGPKDMMYPPHQRDLLADAMSAHIDSFAKKSASDASSLEARINQMQAEKAHEDRLNAIANHFDHLGLAVLASPYVADAAESATRAMMLRGGRVGNLGAHLHTAAEGAQHFLHSHPLLVEGGGLALVAPGVTHRLAKAVDRFRVGPHQPMAPSVPEQPQAASDMRAMSAAAEKVGRLLAHPAPQEKVAINVGGVADWAWKNKKTLAGIGAASAVGAGLYGAKKGVDAVAHLGSGQREPADYVGVPAGMRPPAPAYMPIGS